MATPHAAGLAALYMAINGFPANAAGVYAVRQALIDAGIAQDAACGLANQGDPDTFEEPIGWAGGACALLAPTPTPTATNTPLPTATNTPLPTATNTPLATATNTPLATATNTPLATATNTPLATATNTPLATATNTPLPTATNTPLPTATNTPLATATNTPLPTPVPASTVMTVWSITFAQQPRGPYIDLLITVTIQDTNGSPVSGAAVTGLLWRSSPDYRMEPVRHDELAGPGDLGAHGRPADRVLRQIHQRDEERHDPRRDAEP